MATDNTSAPSTAEQKSFQQWLNRLWHRLTVRFVLVLGVLFFALAVGVDSLQAAFAAHMPSEPLTVGMVSPLSTSLPSSKMAQPESAKSPLRFDAKTAERLGDVGLTAAYMTHNRLTSAHLFTRPLN